MLAAAPVLPRSMTLSPADLPAGWSCSPQVSQEEEPPSFELLTLPLATECHHGIRWEGKQYIPGEAFPSLTADTDAYSYTHIHTLTNIYGLTHSLSHSYRYTHTHTQSRNCPEHLTAPPDTVSLPCTPPQATGDQSLFIM